MPVGHHHGNSKEAAGALSQQLGLGCRPVLGSHQLLGQGELTKGKVDGEKAQPGPPEHWTARGQVGDEQAKKPGNRRQVKGGKRIESSGGHESQEGPCFKTLPRAEVKTEKPLLPVAT